MNLSGLNAEQKNAVLYSEGPMMILAGAGSGKTKTLVSKISYLIKEKRLSPYQILAMTFSNKAAREMRERVLQNIDVPFGALQITTFHSFCANLLRSEATFIGLSRNFTIYDDSESKAIVKAILGRRGISPKQINPNEILYYISWLKNKGHFKGAPEDDSIDLEDPFYQYFLEFEAELFKSNALDFGGLITGCLQLFYTHPNILEKYQNRFEYILIDEYQDTNRAQFKLMKNLAERTKNVCVVGDEDQSIYSWRGADINNILDFEKVYPQSQLYKLEQNYRSSQNIIEAASKVIEKNSLRKGKSMWTDNSLGDLIKVVECRTDREEAQYVVDAIKQLNKSSVNLDNVSCFYRNNSQARLIEDGLRKENIDYKVIGGIKFYDRKEIKDLLSYLRCIVNPQDSLAFSRIINVPARGIGATTLRKLEMLAESESMSLLELISSLQENSESQKNLRLSRRVKSSLEHFDNLISDCQYMVKINEKPSSIYEKVLHESGYLEMLHLNKDYESQARIENLEELLNAIIQFEQGEELPTLQAFLETVALDTDKTMENNESYGQVSLMTIHGSKGLEFEYVFVIGCEENIFPSFRSLDEGENGIEEERRLFYVAMTRAMVELTITFAQSRMLFGSMKFNGPSRFINEIPKEFYEKRYFNQDKSDYYDEDSSIDYDPEFSQEVPEEESVAVSTKPSRGTYYVGQLISHKFYGAGKVQEVEGSGDNEKVSLIFDDGTRKKFMVKFAPLRVLD